MYSKSLLEDVCSSLGVFCGWVFKNNGPIEVEKMFSYIPRTKYSQKPCVEVACLQKTEPCAVLDQGKTKGNPAPFACCVTRQGTPLAHHSMSLMQGVWLGEFTFFLDPWYKGQLQTSNWFSVQIATIDLGIN